MAQQGCCRPNWALLKIAAAVGARAIEDILGAVRTERTFESTDKGLFGFRWKVLVAAFTIGAQIQHGGLR
ncbi:hypothetical protein Q669_16365 [Labrenzia sp. C1B10]|nr:hypothetical protein Q669_16365 [Labrenzia sp. C1B10]ERS06100.1 hypothetical protein Q675_28085 [Labrenzia sp. C1B70]